MKVHYINILLFALPLNILAYNKNKPSITHHTPKIPITRSLCECELYAPANYDNDPQMKRIMQQFHDRISQRLRDYDERMKTTRQKCKDKCDKEIQKIILKDKLEKELMDKFCTLDTDIQSDAIPTCVCEKSVADKMEKTCLKCTQNFGGIVAPSSGVLAGIAETELIVWKPLAIAAAKAEALAEATDLATQAGVKAVLSKIEELIAAFSGEKTFDLPRIVTTSNYKCGTALVKTADEVFGKSCIKPGDTSQYSFCTTAMQPGPQEYYLGNIAKGGSTAYDAEFTLQKGALETAKVGAVKATYAGYEITIIASIVAIVVIVLIMVIIYKILRYRRKKKMKKKLQYIKLLEE
ncbi:rifin PIR protein, putative [Plasmodium reichenowi]|uniref:Rifin PIR protein, putative n=1 Tax=Plasmodium reichenowi TaxID=5854 RepID=A0A2P9D1I5_PLARE|nr:rifin PIR protein, putative [Plasmodium reichenowi]SOV74862.1 rifin PIR protein, putative [Plasmodium reichenowi]